MYTHCVVLHSTSKTVGIFSSGISTPLGPRVASFLVANCVTITPISWLTVPIASGVAQS